MTEGMKMDNIEKRLDAIQSLVEENNKLLKDLIAEKEGDKKIYTDEEIFKLKESLSWKNLSLRTHLPISTLQYRYKRYINS